jgi:putative flippase GtrA
MAVVERGGTGAKTSGQSWRTTLTYPRSRGWPWFGLVGLVSTGFGYAVFVLQLAGVWLGAALAGTVAAAVAFNFQISRRLVFRSNGPALRFVAVYIVVPTINWATLRRLVLIATGTEDPP